LFAALAGYPGQVVNDPARFPVNARRIVGGGMSTPRGALPQGVYGADSRGKDDITWPYAPPAGIDPFNAKSGTAVVYDWDNKCIATGARARQIRMDFIAQEARKTARGSTAGSNPLNQPNPASRDLPDDVLQRADHGFEGLELAFLEKLRSIGGTQKPAGFVRYLENGASAVLPEHPHDGLGPSGDLQVSTRSPGLATAPPKRWVALHEEFTTEAHHCSEPHAYVPPPVEENAAVEPPPASPRFTDQLRHYCGPPRRSFAFHNADRATKERLVREEVTRLNGGVRDEDVDMGRYCGTWDEELRAMRREADANGFAVRGRQMSPPRRRDGATGAEARLAREQEKHAMGFQAELGRGGW